MVELELENFNLWLGDGQICHLDIQTMEVDAIKTLIDGLGQLALADLLDSHFVVQGTKLVELSEQVVKLGDGARGLYVFAEVVFCFFIYVFSLEVIDDFVEVPGEGQHVGVLLSRKLGVDAQSRVLICRV